jgi:hypothetical protein
MVFNDYGKNVQEKEVNPIHHCKERRFAPTRLEIGIKDKNSQTKK